jgi:hypothetical protein
MLDGLSEAQVNYQWEIYGISYKFMELIDKDAEEEYYTKRAEELDRKYNPQNYNDIIPKEKPMDKYMLNEDYG